MKERAMSFATLVGLILLGLVLALAILEVGLGRHGSTGVIVAAYDDRGDCDWEGCYDQRYDQNYGSRDDRNRNRNRNRGAFSPGPFDRSPVDAFNGNTVCLPGSTCYSDDRRDKRGEQPS